MVQPMHPIPLRTPVRSHSWNFGQRFSPNYRVSSGVCAKQVPFGHVGCTFRQKSLQPHFVSM
jgi:hypothetical protein